MFVRSMAFAATDSCRLLCGLYVMMSRCLSSLGPLRMLGEVGEDGSRTSGVFRRRGVLGAVGEGKKRLKGGREGGRWRENFALRSVEEDSLHCFSGGFGVVLWMWWVVWLLGMKRR